MNLRFKLTGRRILLPALALGAVSAALLSGCFSDSNGTDSSQTPPAAPVVAKAATPIQHVVVIFQENVSFDHYFATYPTAKNPAGEPAFTAASGTPTVNNLVTPLNVSAGFAALNVNLTQTNPTVTNQANSPNNILPFRFDRTQAATADQDHDYDDEQRAFDGGAMDLFPLTANVDYGIALASAGQVMGYYDGNTVTAYWNYAQNYAMNDNSFGTTFGPSAPGAINLISGQTNGVIATNVSATPNGLTAPNPAITVSASTIGGEMSSDGVGGITLTSDSQPLGDACMTRDGAQLSGKNIGDMLNAANVSWGFFQGGFDLTLTNANGTTGCKRSTTSLVTGTTKTDYIPHHQPFQYYKSTQNLSHARPSSVMAIGNTYQTDGKTLDPANHQYDIHDFFDAVSAGNFPAVSFLKAPGFQDGHAGYSDPLDEQAFVTQVVNFLQKQPGWANTLVVIAYDDSDGWYDHQPGPILNPSKLTTTTSQWASNGVTGIAGPADWLNGPGACTSSGAGNMQGTATTLSGATGQSGVQGRCGYGPRLPFIVISPYAKKNYVDHTLTDQTSIIRFIEDNWLNSQRITGSYDAIAGTITNMLNLTGTPRTDTLFLDPNTGLPTACANCVANKATRL